MGVLKAAWNIGRTLSRYGGVRGLAKLAKDAPKYAKLYKGLMADSRVPKHAKAVLVGAGIFAVSPLNLPNYIPVIGMLDDIGLVIFANQYFLKKVPTDVLAEHRLNVGLDPA